jgi:hypothetical protein
MPKVEFTVAEIKLPPAGKERGNIVTTDGRKYGLFREKISLCQVGGHYEAEVTDGQYCNIVSAKLILAASPPARQRSKPSSRRRLPTAAEAATGTAAIIAGPILWIASECSSAPHYPPSSRQARSSQSWVR